MEANELIDPGNAEIAFTKFLSTKSLSTKRQVTGISEGFQPMIDQQVLDHDEDSSRKRVLKHHVSDLLILLFRPHRMIIFFLSSLLVGE